MYTMQVTHTDPQGNRSVKTKRYFTRNGQKRAFQKRVKNLLDTAGTNDKSQLIADGVVVYDSEGKY